MEMVGTGVADGAMVAAGGAGVGGLFVGVRIKGVADGAIVATAGSGVAGVSVAGAAVPQAAVANTAMQKNKTAILGVMAYIVPDSR